MSRVEKWECGGLPFTHCFRFYGLFTGGPSSSYEMIALRNNSHGGIIGVCMGIFTTALINKKIRQILNKNTSHYFHSVSLVIWPLTLMKRTHFSELSISRFSTYLCTYVHTYIFLLRIWRFFLFLRAVVNIPIQTLIIPPWLLLRKMIISQLELGPPVVYSWKEAQF